MKRARWASAAALALAALGIAACGSGGSGLSGPNVPSPGALGKEVTTAIKKATSVHVAGDVTDKGQQLSLNLSLTSSGDIDGQVAVGGKSYTVLVSRGRPFVLVDAAFLKLAHLPHSLCAKICGKYISVPASSVGGLLGGSSWASFVNGFGGKAPDLTYAGTATVDGVAAWKVTGSTRVNAVYLAAAAPHFPVRIMHKGQHVDFSEWNAVTIPPPPKGKELVNLSSLAG